MHVREAVACAYAISMHSTRKMCRYGGVSVYETLSWYMHIQAADLVLLWSDPSTDIRNTRDIAHVVRDGVVWQGRAGVRTGQ